LAEFIQSSPGNKPKVRTTHARGCITTALAGQYCLGCVCGEFKIDS
jgi:hypothetical protein